MKFSYKGFDQAGKPSDGSVEAANIAEAKDALRRQGIFALNLQESGSTTGPATESTRASHGGSGRQLRNVAMFTRQLYVLISTGTPLVEALAALERQAKDPAWRGIVVGIRTRVEEGASLSSALSHYPSHFNAVCRSLIAAGESGGKLGEMLDRLSVLTRKQVHIRNSIIGALTYPVLLIVVAVTVLLILMTFVLPRFAELFKTLDTPLPPTTQMLMVMSDVIRTYWLILLVGTIGGSVGLWYWLKTEPGRRMISTISLKIPKIGGIVRSFSTARITRLLGILLQGHVPLVESLQLTWESVSNHHYMTLLALARDAVTRGEPLASAFSSTDLVAPSVYEAMRSGDKNGQLGPLLMTVADFLEEENEVTLKSLTSILEPMILIVLGVFVGFVALSLFMPLFDLTAATRGS